MKKPLLYIISFLLLLTAVPGFVYAQPYDPARINKKTVAVYDDAISKARAGNLAEAAKLLEQAIQSEPGYVDAYLSLAGVYSEQKQPEKSIQYYEAAFLKDSNYTLDYKLPYSISLATTGRFEEALKAINELLDKKPPKNEKSLKAAQYRQRCYAFAVSYAQKNTGHNAYVFAPQNAGPAINSKELEYFPSLTIDGSEMIFTRRVNHANEDFFISKKENGEWTPAAPMKGVNTPLNEASQNISPDGEWLVFTGCNRPDGFGSCDIYIAYREKDGWSEAMNLGGTINTDQWESQPCLSPDKKALYFASTRFGGYGGSDIYVSYLQDNGRWGTPQNLGPGINTPGDEQCPFIHADNQTLYFTSDHWPGYGDADLFYTRKGPGGDWSQPVNLGYPINTIGKEGTLYITPDGKTAYYSSDKNDSYGGLDIFSFEMREDIRPLKTLWVKGRVFDKKTSRGLPSEVELADLTTGKKVSNIQTDEQGHFFITLPVGKDYSFNVSRSGYLFYSDNFLLAQSAPDSTYTKEIPLQPIEANASIILKNIFFDVNLFDLQPASRSELDKVVRFLKDNPAVKIEISGHTDNTGKETDNLTLSNNRAKAVVSYLAAQQINPQRLVYKGYGSAKPVRNNDSEEGRAANRRTELKIIGR